MRYSKEFFALQIEFTQKLATKFGGDFRDYLFDFTTFSKSLGIGSPGDATNSVWRENLAGLISGDCIAEDSLADWTYEFYLTHNGRHDALPYGETFHGYPLFGCFYYEVRAGNAVRPHFVKNDASGLGMLSRERFAVRRIELQRMFQHVHTEHPETEMVVGSSWLYNLEAYRRLFPPEFTAQLEVNEEDEFQFLVRWGQLFDKDWQVKPLLAQTFFKRLEALERIEDLRRCFSYPILKVGCPIEHFYTFYGL